MNFRRFVIIAKLQQPNVKNLQKKICVFLGKTTLYGKIFTILFGKVFIATPINVLCLNFVKFRRWQIGEILRCLPDKKQNFAWLFSCRYFADRAQNLPEPDHDSLL